MSDRILCVDDEPEVLGVCAQMLQPQFDVDVADGPESGLAAVRQRGPHAVILSDMNMPGMTGLQFLRQARQLAPDSVPMLLTGRGDQQVAIEAINEGSVFRFLHKPCPLETLVRAVDAGVRQHHLITSERQLLAGTLRGTIEVLTDVLALANPRAFGRAQRVRQVMHRLARELQAGDPWPFEAAALLSQLGCIALPEAVAHRAAQGADLLRKIPRLDGVADIIASQDKQFDGRGYPDDGRAGDEIPLGARALKVALDFDGLRAAGCSAPAAIEELRSRTGWYDPAILEALDRVHLELVGYVQRLLPVRSLRAEMVLDESLHAPGGLLARKGFVVTELSILRLADYVARKMIPEYVHVLVPPGWPEAQ